nr:RraA family protein [Aminobacter niigataensis]
MSIGFRVLARSHKISSDLVEKFRELPVANVSDGMQRLYAGGARLRPMHAGGFLAGPALTVRVPAGDNLMLHKALQMIEPGDVVVVDAAGETRNAITGELMMDIAKNKGAAGVVIYGAIRDSGYFATRNFPIYACGVTHRGPYRNGPGEINVPVSVDGMLINPGDLVIGDEDGVLCVPYAEADEIYRAGKAKLASETMARALTESGKLDKPWIDETLRKLNCEGV